MALAPTFLEFGTHVVVFFLLRGTSGLQFGTPGPYFGKQWASFLCFFTTLGRGPESFKHLRGKASEKVQKIIELGSPEGRNFMII